MFEVFFRVKKIDLKVLESDLQTTNPSPLSQNFQLFFVVPKDAQCSEMYAKLKIQFQEHFYSTKLSIQVSSQVKLQPNTETLTRNTP